MILVVGLRLNFRKAAYGGRGPWAMQLPALNSTLYAMPPSQLFMYNLTSSIQIRDDASGQDENVNAEYIREKT